MKRRSGQPRIKSPSPTLPKVHGGHGEMNEIIRCHRTGPTLEVVNS